MTWNKLGLCWIKLVISQLWLAAVNNCKDVEISIFNFIYIYIHTHTYTYIHIHTYIYTHTHIHIHTYIYLHIFVCGLRCSYMLNFSLIEWVSILFPGGWGGYSRNDNIPQLKQTKLKLSLSLAKTAGSYDFGMSYWVFTIR